MRYLGVRLQRSILHSDQCTRAIHRTALEHRLSSQIIIRDRIYPTTPSVWSVSVSLCAGECNGDVSSQLWATSEWRTAAEVATSWGFYEIAILVTRMNVRTCAFSLMNAQPSTTSHPLWRSREQTTEFRRISSEMAWCKNRIGLSGESAIALPCHKSFLLSTDLPLMWVWRIEQKSLLENVSTVEKKKNSP